ncbi:MAG TPA: hypothetical protein VIR58_08915 [Acidimicrobiales bacterium]
MDTASATPSPPPECWSIDRSERKAHFALWQRLDSLLQDAEALVAELPPDLFTVAYSCLAEITTDEHRRRESTTDDPWDELRYEIAQGQLRLVWAELEDCDGRIEDDGRERRIILCANGVTWNEYREILAHELTHHRRDFLYTPDTDDSFVEEEEVLVNAYALSRLGKAVGIAAADHDRNRGRQLGRWMCDRLR